eukprot:315290-Chlamydomonas_euryale.AAC.5
MWVEEGVRRSRCPHRRLPQAERSACRTERHDARTLSTKDKCCMNIKSWAMQLVQPRACPGCPEPPIPHRTCGRRITRL